MQMVKKFNVTTPSGSGEKCDEKPLYFGIIHQLHIFGVLELVILSQVGFPCRIGYGRFIHSYRLLFQSSLRRRMNRKHCCSMLQSLTVTKDFECGTTKIFFRAGRVDFLEWLPLDKLNACGIIIQWVIRGFI